MLAASSTECQRAMALLFDSQVSHFTLFDGGIPLRCLFLEVMVKVRFLGNSKAKNSRSII